MIGGKDWLGLVIVSCVALGFVTLMIVIQAAQHGRTRGEILRGVGLVWGAVAVTLLLAWLLEDHWGGALIDIQVSPEPRVLTRSLTGSEAATLAVLVAALIGLYLTAIMTVKRLTLPVDQIRVGNGDESDGEGGGEGR
ncbi:MAG: hypothetical protein ACOX9R_12865 [Armatimonadota bacterium]|jgi:hypothetical protein